MALLEKPADRCAEPLHHPNNKSAPFMFLEHYPTRHLQIFPNHPGHLSTELTTVNDDIHLVIAVKTPLVQVCRPDHRPAIVNEHDLGMKNRPLAFENLDPPLEEQGIGTPA